MVGRWSRAQELSPTVGESARDAARCRNVNGRDLDGDCPECGRPNRYHDVVPGTLAGSRSVDPAEKSRARKRRRGWS